MTGSTRLKCVLIFIFIADLSGMPKNTPYEFTYNVDDSLSGNDFGHWESSDGQAVHGQYHVLLPDGQRQTVTYTADALNGYQAKVAVNTSAFKVADSIQQGVNQGKESNIVQALTYDQDTEKPPKYMVCPSVMRNRYDECKAKCTKLSCWWHEKRNFLYACLSGIIQTCIGSPTTPAPTTLAPKSRVECGIEKEVGRRIGNDETPTRIINGVNVDVPRKYSWIVGVKYWDNDGQLGTYECVGSIITRKHVLTAANCLYYSSPNRPINVVYVGIGDHKQFQVTDNHPDFVKPIRSKKLIIHNDFNWNTKENDIAIIELSTPIDLEKHAEDIHPICLPKDDSETYEGLTATISGWGTVGEDFYKNVHFYKDVLQEAQVPVLTNSRCSKQIKNSILISNGITLKHNMICAASKKSFNEGGKVACLGDSGGPLSVKENRQHVQIGIVSIVDRSCASKENPSVYTRVSKFLRWIKKEVGSETIYTLP